MKPLALALAGLLVLPGAVASATTATSATSTSSTTAGSTALRPAEKVHFDLLAAAPVAVGQDWQIRLRISNDSADTVDHLQVTSRRGDAVHTAAAARAELATGTYPYYGAVAHTDSLAPGQSRELTMVVPTKAVPSGTLAITQPGAYPVMLTLTGTIGGEPVALADDRLILTANPPATAPPTPAPVHGLSLIYPVTAPLDIVPGETGGTPLLLSSEQLAGQISPGGRLDALVSAYLAHDLRGAGCMALDPGLVNTVQRMAGGYQVGTLRPPAVEKHKRLRDSWFPSTAQATKPGSGSLAAQAWLDKLTRVDCIVAMPWANTDVNAVARTQNPELLEEAVAQAEILASLQAKPQADTLLVTDSGFLNPTTAAALPAGTKPLQAGNFEPALAVLAAGAAGQQPNFANPQLAYDLRLDSPVARRLSAAAALRAETQRTDSLDTVLKLPNVQEVAAAVAMLDTAQELLAAPAGTALRAIPITEVAARADQPGIQQATAQLRAQLGTAADQGVSDPDILQVKQQAHYTDELMNILVPDPGVALTPNNFTAPLRRDLLIALSRHHGASANNEASGASVNNEGTAATAERVDHARLRQNSAMLQNLRGSVMLIPPGNVYTRTSESSPLLIVAQNALPLPVDARIQYQTESGTLSTPSSLWIPAKGSITVSMTADLPERRDIQLWLATPTGATISQPVTITVQTRGGMLGIYVVIAVLVALGALTLRRKKHS